MRRDARREPVGFHPTVGLAFFLERGFLDRPTGGGVGGALEHELAGRCSPTRRRVAKAARPEASEGAGTSSGSTL